MTKAKDISIVVTARNDDHGQEFLRRMQIFLNGFQEQSRNQNLRSELIIVEWNPPVHKPRLCRALSWPKPHDSCVVRIIEVPERIHRNYVHASRLPLYQMIGKNVGIRRARGQFVLATNIDILFSNELIRFLSRGKLNQKRVYRVDRYDVPMSIPMEAAIDEQLEYCRQNVIRVNSREGTQNLLTGRFFGTYLGLNAESSRLHFNACGDFTLMSKKDWYALRGYPEFDMYSAHIDSLLLLMAYHSGMRQEVLQDPMRIYHMEHASSMIAEKANKLSRRLRSADVPVVKLSQLEEWADEMTQNGRPILFNGEDWGVAAESLKETVLYPGDQGTQGDVNLSCLSESETEATPGQCEQKRDTVCELSDVGAEKNDPKTGFPSLSVIIVWEHGRQMLERCLDSLLYQRLVDSEYEVVVVVAKSRADKSLRARYKGKKNVRFLMKSYRNVSQARAIGVDRARGRTVFFLRDDSIADEDLLYEHWSFHTKNPPQNQGLLALYQQANFAMLGKREWDTGLEQTDLMKHRSESYQALRDGEVLDWWKFRCDNLSCSRDFLIRYGSFDDVFEECGDVELGYRLSKHNLNLIYNSMAKAYVGIPHTLKAFCADAFSEGYFSSVLLRKHRDRDVELWCREDNARIRVEKLGHHLAERGEYDHEDSQQPSVEYYDRVFEYHRSRGIMAAQERKLSNIHRIFSNKLFEKAKPAKKRTILVIGDRVPSCEMGGQDRSLYRFVGGLATYHRVIFLARKMREGGKYIQSLRTLGVRIFYDAPRVRGRSLMESVIFHHAAGTTIETVLTRLSFDAVYLEHPRLVGDYIHEIRRLSPQSVVITNASGRESDESEYTGIHWADLVLAKSDREAQSLPARQLSELRVLPDGADDRRFHREVCRLIESLPEPHDDRPEMFRILPGVRMDGFWPKQIELTVVLIVEDGSKASRLSFESVCRNTDRDRTGILVAIHKHVDDEVRERVETGCVPYFVYRDEEELNCLKAKVMEECQSGYFGIAHSNSIFPPLWDRRIMACIQHNPEIDLIGPSATQTAYASLYDFEKEAWKAYEEFGATYRFAERLETACIIIRRSLFEPGTPLNTNALMEKLGKSGLRLAEAKGTRIWDLKGTAKNKREAITAGISRERSISVIIPSHNAGKSLTRCLESLCDQDCIHSREIEVIVVDDGSEDGTREALRHTKAPCEFRWYGQPFRGPSAAINRGINEASGRLLIFLSPYARPSRDLLSEHLKMHEGPTGGDAAVLGYISCGDRKQNTRFMSFLLRNPKLLWPSGVVYDFTDVHPAENVDPRKFFTGNISLRREIFDEVGLFDESFNHGFQDFDFGLRFCFKGYRIVYNPNAIVYYHYQTDLAQFLCRQILAGRQYGLMCRIHPSLNHAEGVENSCVYKYLGKESLIERIKKIIQQIERMPHDIQMNYKYPGSSLLDQCYHILANYYFCIGFDELMQELEGVDWVQRFIAKRGIQLDEISKQNRAYELLMSAYLSSGGGNWEESIQLTNKAKTLTPWHAGVDFALGSFHMDLKDYKAAESAFEKGLRKRRTHESDAVFPAEDEGLYSLWLAMACIAQGRHNKAAAVLEDLIGEQRPLSLAGGAFVYKCLGLCYGRLGNPARALACREEAERLKDEDTLRDPFRGNF